jgi:cytosol aminopeptidase
VDSFDNDSQSAAEGAFLGLFDYEDMRSKSTGNGNGNNGNGNGTVGNGNVAEESSNGNSNGDDRKEVHLQLLTPSATTEPGWKNGVTIARSQNVARRLGETPSNYLTPSLFVQHVVQAFAHLNQNVDGIASHTSTKYAYRFDVEEKVAKSEIEFPNLDIKLFVRDYDWLKENKMGGVLGVSQGSDEPPRFLEIHYGGRNSTLEKPLCLVGKGITFDTGGISIKPSAGMAAMKGDMGGASCVVGAIHALAALQVPLKVTGLIPLSENMPSGKAIKPGDVLVAMSGKTIEVDNTDAEGRLILADGLHYAHSFNPHTIIDLATLTGAIDIALGSFYTGVFTNDQTVWSNLEASGHVTGEQMWRMPLSAKYRKAMSSTVADIRNASNSRGAGSCTAAIFLKDFVKHNRWAHLDIAGVYRAGDGSYPYLTKYMTGVPTRTLVHFARSLASGEFTVPQQHTTTTTATPKTTTEQSTATTK